MIKRTHPDLTDHEEGMFFYSATAATIKIKSFITQAA
jgi:hypothetical protein